ncbi:uncharacterized protein LOC108909578 isoform X2 [Anoplophora glabripennis]|uniref:uncharacterized protein LOC108909578 isoform X2 n=1 Tax=Anoplophora glabripennis TaxID=217634 RepID=UPI0008735900|nr:uncharacterized protein LOC108909578 isoform X2 [Anoplophora glabripennis]
MSYAPDMKNITHLHFTTFPLFLLLFYLAEYGDAGGGIPGLEISMPPSHVALSGDLHVQIAFTSFTPLLLQLSRLEGNLAQPLTTFPVFSNASAPPKNSTIVKIPCGYFSKGGQYYILVKKKPVGSSNITTLDNQDTSVITRSLDVRWPMPQLTVTPEHIQTYPESPVTAIVEFPEVVCPPVADSPASAIPEFWLELHYCGHSLLTCDNPPDDQNKTGNQVLYSEQVRGFPGKQDYILRCELFGLAGHYALFLRPTTPSPALPHTAAYVKADWSEQFVFNVHAHSIFPCDVHNGGVTVLFQYPSCILAKGDRVRLFARLRANVASLAPPTTLEYVAEQRVVRNQHSLQFDCDLFTERYVEYCFVYVSQAISGAVADVRMDCVPTLPVSDQESGSWGPWSAWTQCSSTCIGGTRSRYRFCDSPPPRYGVKFCEGPAVETEKCGTNIGSGWECFYGNGAFVGESAAEAPEVIAEVGPYCRCGCVVHLGQAKPKRLLATSAQSCPGRTFWLIQADEDFVIQFKVDQFHLPCGNQWLKIRDGNALSSNLLADLSGGHDVSRSVVNSTGPNLLLEYFSDENLSARQICGGGFLAHASQIRNIKPNITSIVVAQSVGAMKAVTLKLTAVHIAAIFFLSGLLIATALLGAQYLFRYRKYHVAKAEDQDSLADPKGSNTSLPMATRASSSATLLSEVISLTKLRPHIKARNKHTRLRESMDCGSTRSESEIALAKEEDSLSASSTATLTQPETQTASLPQTTSETEEAALTCSLPSSPQLGEKRTLRRSSTLTSEKDRSNEKDEAKGNKGREAIRAVRRLSNVSNATLTNVSAMSQICSRSDPGCYSPAASMISTATIRSTNAKETKEKRNREKLLAGPTGSEFSIVAQDLDLEMDYYDYNVVNAGAAPGSYLVWIPPLDESGEILPEEDQEYHEMEDIRPKVYIDPGSNKESPEEEMLLPKCRKRSLSDVSANNSKRSPIFKPKCKRVHPLIHKESSEKMDNKFISEVQPLVHQPKTVSIQLHEFPKKLRASPKLLRKDMEKETKVEKSPSLDGDFLDGIKFADEEDEDLNENECNIDVPYQDSNILSSS